ncbi:MAG: family 16 glycosylhydrolase [Spirochaetales bacterium]|nr:family 16 glycosylhydrolase [Spirochaetales bacterium]
MKFKIQFFILVMFLIFSCALSAQQVTNFKGAEVFSHEAVLFGKFEVRMRMVNEKGMVSSFFLYDNKSWQGLPHLWREIDIEALGKEKNLLQTNIITGHAASKLMSELKHKVENLHSEYHTYTVEWTPDYIAVYVDGVLLRKDTAAENQQVADLRDTPLTYRMNLWISDAEEWAGRFNKNTLPRFQYVNWIKYYEYTPGKGPGGSDFTLAWTDDFNSFNTERWGAGNWGFEGNMAAFDPANAVIKNGYLILCLTKASETGLKGLIPEDN